MGEHIRANERRMKVYAMIFDAAEAGDPCPTNPEMAAACGYSSASSISGTMECLERNGMIQRHGPDHARQVEILATGKITALRKCRPVTVPTHRRSVQTIVEIVARTAALSVGDLLGRKRQMIYVRPRLIAYHFAAEEGWSYARIGRDMAGRCHSTVIPGARQVPAMLAKDRLFARLFERTREALEGAPVPTVTLPESPKPVPRGWQRHPLEIDENDPEQVQERHRRMSGSRLLLSAIRTAYPEGIAA